MMTDLHKDWKPPQPGSMPSQLTDRLNRMRSTLRVLDPSLVAERSASSCLTLGPGRGELHVPFWENACIFSIPEWIGYVNHNPLPDFQQALLLYYLLTADGAPLTGRWVSFADLPDGRTYNAAFQGYSGNELVKKFSLDLDAFKDACPRAGGVEADIGSASFIFHALPRVPLLVTYWLGDEDFPSSCKILFDESASHYLPIDACAILGSMLTRKLISNLSR
jgi:hypothetical protein